MPDSPTFHTAGRDGYNLSIAQYGERFNKTFTVPDQCPTPVGLPMPDATDISTYLRAVEDLRHSHRSAGGGKTVLSRVIRGVTDTETLAETTVEYFRLNPHAFCALVRIADDEVWLVATPEVLIHADGSTFQTMALAGTRAIHVGTEDAWDSKNIAEQRIVTDYITGRWSAIGLTPETAGPATLRSGNIEHICTRIMAPRKPGVSVAEAIDAIAPTPAVCGFPLDLARKNIAEHEAYNRGLYAGYIAITEPGGNLDAFVTLRCARINPLNGEFAVIVGGGITADSVPEHELTETDLKAQTILSLLDTRPTSPIKNNRQ